MAMTTNQIYFAHTKDELERNVREIIRQNYQGKRELMAHWLHWYENNRNQIKLPPLSAGYYYRAYVNRDYAYCGVSMIYSIQVWKRYEEDPDIMVSQYSVYASHELGKDSEDTIVLSKK